MEGLAATNPGGRSPLSRAAIAEKHKKNVISARLDAIKSQKGSRLKKTDPAKARRFTVDKVVARRATPNAKYGNVAPTVTQSMLAVR